MVLIAAPLGLPTAASSQAILGHELESEVEPIRECMTGIAMRKKGLTDPHYLSPLTTSHGQN